MAFTCVHVVSNDMDSLILMTWIVSNNIVSYMDSRFSKQNLSSKDGTNPTFRKFASCFMTHNNIPFVGY